jgi:p24 family protein alpha
MHLFLLLASLFILLSPSYSLYFYLEGSQTRCFLEDLPKDTLVVGITSFP